MITIDDLDCDANSNTELASVKAKIKTLSMAYDYAEGKEKEDIKERLDKLMKYLVLSNKTKTKTKDKSLTCEEAINRPRRSSNANYVKHNKTIDDVEIHNYSDEINKLTSDFLKSFTRLVKDDVNEKESSPVVVKEFYTPEKFKPMYKVIQDVYFLLEKLLNYQTFPDEHTWNEIRKEIRDLLNAMN